MVLVDVLVDGGWIGSDEDCVGDGVGSDIGWVGWVVMSGIGSEIGDGGMVSCTDMFGMDGMDVDVVGVEVVEAEVRGVVDGDNGIDGG